MASFNGGGITQARIVATLLVAALVTPACAQSPLSIGHGRTPNARSTHTRPPLVLGTNLALFDSTDHILNHPASQRLLKRAQVPIIRMPFRSAQGDIWEVEALRAIQYIRAIPVVIVHGPADANALTDDRQLIALVRGVFGNSTVYVEFGNEPDLAGIDVERYVATWNGVIPALKAMAPTYRFVGPAASGPDPTYIATFDRFANPPPDALSWHEYVCQPEDSDEYCIAHVDDWTTHIHAINQGVRGATGKTVPTMITEWNLDARLDARFENPSFMLVWTRRALQTLAANQANGLIAAMQYCVASSRQFNLVDATGSLTAEGQVFFQTLSKSAAAS